MGGEEEKESKRNKRTDTSSVYLEKLHQKPNRKEAEQHGRVYEKDEWFLSTISHNIRYVVTEWMMPRRLEDLFDSLY